MKRSSQRKNKLSLKRKKVNQKRSKKANQRRKKVKSKVKMKLQKKKHRSQKYRKMKITNLIRCQNDQKSPQKQLKLRQNLNQIQTRRRDGDLPVKLKYLTSKLYLIMIGEFRQNNLCRLEMIVLKVSQTVQVVLTVVKLDLQSQRMLSQIHQSKKLIQCQLLKRMNSQDKLILSRCWLTKWASKGRSICL